MVVQRPARFVWDEAAKLYRVEFLSVPGKDDESPRLALPNSRLERIEEVLAEFPEAVFTISGETTVYGETEFRRRAYILIRLATVNLPAKPTGKAATPPATAEAAKAESATNTASADPASPSPASPSGLRGAGEATLSEAEEWLLSEPDDDDDAAAPASRGAGVPPASPEGVPPAADAEGDLSSSGGLDDGAHSAGGTPAPQDAEAEDASEGDPDSVLREMLRERPATPILAPTASGSPVEAPSVAPRPAVRMQLPTAFGPLLNERMVRLSRDKDGWWFIRFENDNALTQPPMRVLPNSNLTRARALSQSKTGVELRIVVWGEVVHYKGTPYILLRRVIKHQAASRF